MSKILVVNGSYYGRAVEGLGDIVTDPAELVKSGGNFKLVLFTGGEDVTPEYYNHTSPLGMCYNSVRRDRAEAEIIAIARALGIRCIGICRGLQFINVMAGGTMYHDVKNHSGGVYHNMTTSTNKLVRVNSLHHQMVCLPEDSHLIGWATTRRSETYYGDEDKLVEAPDKEVEAALYPSLESAGVQYHPEHMEKDSRGYKWFYELARDLINIENFDDIIEKYSGETCKNQYIQSQY